MSMNWETQVVPEIDHQIAAALRRLELPGLPPDKTEFERGRIAALRHILKLPDELKRKGQ